MAFKLEKILGSQTSASELTCYVPCGVDGAKTWKEGMAVKVSDGVMAYITGDNSPMFLVLVETKTTSAKELVPCMKILPNMVFRTCWSVNPGEAAVGRRPNVIGGVSLSPFSPDKPNGPLIVDMLGGKAAKDEALVMFDK